MINMGVTKTARRADDSSALRVEQGWPRGEMLGQIAIVFKALFIASGPGGHAWVIADGANQRVVKTRRSQRKGAILGIPGLEVILPNHYPQLVRNIVKLRVVKMAMEPDEIDVHLHHESQVPLVAGPVHL